MQYKKMSNEFYSDGCARLAQLQSQDAGMRARRLELDVDDVVPFMRDYNYPLSAWPFIIGAQRVSEFDNFITRLPKLYLKAIKSLFSNRVEEFSAYLNESPFIHEMLMDPGFDMAQMVNRHDVVFSNGQLKLLEVNAGSAIGGWQPGLLEPQFRQVMGEFAETASWQVRHRHVIDQLFRSVFAAIGLRKPALQRRNVLMYCLVEDAIAGEALRERFDLTVAGMDQQGREHRLFFFSDFSKLTFASDGSVCYDGQVMDAILITDSVHDAPKSVYLRLIGAHLTRKIVMPDSMMYTIFGNKLLMALLHEPALRKHLTADELAFIAAHIPFTARMKDEVVEWEGRPWPLRELLRERQDAFVVKKAHSFQGRDVYIGKYMSREEWEEVIARVGGDADWLAQEYCTVDCASAPDAAGTLSDYAMVWGIFDTGNRYGGAFIRGMAADGGGGVINSARGAVEFCVFEEGADAVLA